MIRTSVIRMPGWVNSSKCSVVFARNKEGELTYFHSSNKHSKIWEQFERLISMKEVDECRVMTIDQFNNYLKTHDNDQERNS